MDAKVYMTKAVGEWTVYAPGHRFRCWPRLSQVAAAFILLAGGVFAFSAVGAVSFELLTVPANTNHGFHWPYYLSIPASANNATVLLIEPNNSPFRTNTWAVHDGFARHLLTNRTEFA